MSELKLKTTAEEMTFFKATPAQGFGHRVISDLENCLAEIERLRSVLKFYANEKNYEEKTFWIDAPVKWSCESTEVQNDEGQRARDALK